VLFAVALGAAAEWPESWLGHNIRNMKPEALYRSVEIGGRRALDLQSVGVLRALDLYRVCQIADRLDVSVDWLLGSSNVMEIPTRECQA